MTVCLNNPVLGREISDNFTFDDTNNQIVPKPGTDTKPGALALNLGNTAGDTTNATDALTAAGFNAMASAPDTTDPFCGNEIQQAVTAAVAQSIACDADAQEAIACAIASNPEAVACLQAVLGGSSTSGKYYVATSTATRANCYLVNNGVVTNLTPSGVPGFTNIQIKLLEVNKDNPVAYYFDALSSGGPGTMLRQVTMSDTGVTVTNFDMTTTLTAPSGVDANFYWLFDYATYDPLTKALYIKVQAGGRNTAENSTTLRTALVKLTLNAQGLATGSSVALMLLNPDDPSVVTDGYIGGQAAQGKIPLSSGKIFDAVTGTVLPGTPAGDYGIDRSMSPDGSKYAGRLGVSLVTVYDTATNNLLCTIAAPAGMPLSSNAGFPEFSEDGETVFVAWQSERLLKETAAYNATTGVIKPTAVAFNQLPPSAPNGFFPRIVEPTASNGAVLLHLGGGTQRVGIFEASGDNWTQVALIPDAASQAGFYLVSA